jgi:competence protein ComEC
MNKYQYIRLMLVGCIFLVLSAFLYTALTEKKTTELRVTFFDIGQGDAIYIKSPTGKEMIVDASVDNRILTKLGKTMTPFDRTIDVAVATHPDKDHIGGLPAVLDRYKVGMLLESGAASDNGVHDEMHRVAQLKNIKVVSAFKGQRIELGGGAIATVLFPDRGVGGMETNDASIVILLTYGNQSFLLTGDAPISTEYSILAGVPELTVLKAGHHGSQTATSFELLEKSTPEYTVLSVGAQNSYGHPHKSVTDRLTEFRSAILRTDTMGDISFYTDGDSVRVVKQKQ